MACTVSRFGKYVKMIGNREYCDVKEFAQQSGRLVKAVVKDLKKMIKKGWFRQGHLDEQETCLMTSNEAYRQYTALMERTRREKQEKEERAAKEQEEFSPQTFSGSPEDHRSRRRICEGDQSGE